MPSVEAALSRAVFEPLTAETLARKVTDQLRQAIYAGKFAPGERLVELRIAKQMGVGQSSVREALKELEHLGLIVKHPNRGSFIVDLSEEESRQIYVVRGELESLALKLAMQRRTPEAISQIRIALGKMKQAARVRDFDTFVDADIDFHRRIWRLSGNPFLEEALMHMAARQFAFYRIQAMQGKATWNMNRLVKTHAEILNRLQGRSRKSSSTIIDELRSVALEGVNWGDAASEAPAAR